MDSKGKSRDIAYQNKDIVSKLFGERMKGKSLSLLGLGTDLKVMDVRPTNIPIVQARELRMDNVFELEDGSVAILDYESEYKKENFTKYGRYVIDVIDRYLREGRGPDIHMLVLYTADIERAQTSMRRTALSVETETAYLVGVPSKEWMEEARKCIAAGDVPDEVLMHLVLLPLTYKGAEKKQTAIKECVDLARQIQDKGQESFVLAGILSFTDKVINEVTRQYVKEVIGMTQVGKMLMDEGMQKGMQKGDIERARKTALKMLSRGDSLEEVAEILELPEDTVKAWGEEAYAMV